MDKEYIIDSNILISSSRRFYPFDIMPGFWRQFLEKIDGKVVLIDKVKEEIFSGNDQLSDWLRENQACFIQKIVTEETYDPNSKKRVKIPNICKGYEIEYIDMLRFFREIEVKIL